MTSPKAQSLTEAGHLTSQQPSRRKILYASAHSILDFSNGASVATLDMLQALTALGLECQAFCTTKLDFNEDVCFEKIVGDLHEPFQVRPSVCGDNRARVLYTRRRQVPITFLRLDSTRHVQQSPQEIDTIHQFFQSFLEIYRPDVLLTYGGDAVTQGMIALARRRGIPVVFAIHNLAYNHRQPFAHIDHCIVASQFARRHYWETLSLDCRALPNPVDWDRVRVADRDPRFVTFVNPALYKGPYPFVRIAIELGRLRPDIPLLVVESRGPRHTLGTCGLMTADHLDIRIMPVTTDPRRFWHLTRIALLPSICRENQPRLAIEAMINGLPVIGRVNARGRLLRDGPELPARVATLDDLMLVVRRDTPLRFDPELGFHLYRADICLQAHEQSLAVVAIGALCHHNSRSDGLPESFYCSAEVFAGKWKHRLPVATPCVVIDRGGEVYLLGNATDRPGSVALAEQCLRGELSPTSHVSAIDSRDRAEAQGSRSRASQPAKSHHRLIVSSSEISVPRWRTSFTHLFGASPRRAMPFNFVMVLHLPCNSVISVVRSRRLSLRGVTAMNRDVIGGLDERFGLGFFDDDDLAERARRAGFELAVAHDLFVHHFGSRTFTGNGIDANKLLDENARRFAAKWGSKGANGRRVALTPFTADPPKNGDDDPRPQISQINADSDLRFQTSGNRVKQS
jgi:glycosyltransferase involved in cell wall biosynthesis